LREISGDGEGERKGFLLAHIKEARFRQKKKSNFAEKKEEKLLARIVSL